MIADPILLFWYVRGWNHDPAKPYSQHFLEAYEAGWRDRENADVL